MLDALLSKLGKHDDVIEVVTQPEPVKPGTGEALVENARMNRGRQGPLPVLLIGLTVVTGLVDAFSYLSLGHVFVANMTGNVVFLGFGLAGPFSSAVLGSCAVTAGRGRRRPGGQGVPGARLRHPLVQL